MSRSLRIAVADDEPDMRRYFQKCLPRLGHQVVAIAANGRELVELCRAVEPDLVITDIRMPEQDGVAAAATIVRERPVPVIFVSAHGLPPEDDAKAIPSACHLAKPVTQGNLEAAIAGALHRFDEAQALAHDGTT
jgi:response regulator NasT